MVWSMISSLISSIDFPNIREALPAFPIAVSLKPKSFCIFAASPAMPTKAVDAIPIWSFKVPNAFAASLPWIAMLPVFVAAIDMVAFKP